MITPVRRPAPTGRRRCITHHLGLILQTIDRPEEATMAFEETLVIDPEFKDAERAKAGATTDPS